MAHEGSIPECATAWGMQRGRAAYPLPRCAVLPRTSCSSKMRLGTQKWTIRYLRYYLSVMTLSSEEFERKLHELADAMGEQPSLRPVFFASSAWEKLAPLPASKMLGRPLWIDRRNSPATSELAPDEFIKFAHSDLIEAKLLGEDDLEEFDPPLASAYYRQAKGDESSRIPGLPRTRVPNWQRRIMRVGPQSSRKEIGALAFALRRALAKLDVR
jgi:hypothetical protein